MRYDLIELAQLVFALSVMFGAFLGGIAVGWWRWARPEKEHEPESQSPLPSAGLFSAQQQEPRWGDMDLATQLFDTTAHPSSTPQVFAAATPELAESTDLDR